MMGTIIITFLIEMTYKPPWKVIRFLSQGLYVFIVKNSWGRRFLMGRGYKVMLKLLKGIRGNLIRNIVTSLVIGKR